MKLKKSVLVCSIICFILSVIYLCIGLVANNHMFATEENTIELSGIVVIVEKDDGGYLVLLEDEVAPIRVASDAIVNEQYMQALSEGDIIQYSVLNDMWEMVKNGNSDLILPICAIRSVQGQIVTINSYNASVEHDKAEIMKISLSVFAVLLSVAIVLLFVFIIRLKRYKKSK